MEKAPTPCLLAKQSKSLWARNLIYWFLLALPGGCEINSTSPYQLCLFWQNLSLPSWFFKCQNSCSLLSLLKNDLLIPLCIRAEQLLSVRSKQWWTESQILNIFNIFLYTHTHIHTCMGTELNLSTFPSHLFLAVWSQFTSLLCSTQHYYSTPTATTQHLLWTSASNIYIEGWFCLFYTKPLREERCTTGWVSDYIFISVGAMTML